MKWPLKYRIWRFLHVIINDIAWEFKPTVDRDDPDRDHWLWRLNNWVASHYTDWFVRNQMSKQHKEGKDESKS